MTPEPSPISKRPAWMHPLTINLECICSMLLFQRSHWWQPMWTQFLVVIGNWQERDAKLFQHLCSALSTVGFSDEEIDSIFQAGDKDPSNEDGHIPWYYIFFTYTDIHGSWAATLGSSSYPQLRLPGLGWSRAFGRPLERWKGWRCAGLVDF